VGVGPLLALHPMPNGRPEAEVPTPPRTRARRSVPNEEGLRSLGEQMRASAAPPRRPRRGGDRHTDYGAADEGAPDAPRRAGEESPLAYPDPRDPLGRRARREELRRTRRRRWVRAVLVVGVVLVVLLGAAAGYLGYLNSLIHRVKVLGLRTGATSGALAGSENILLVGSTSRCALKHQNPSYGLCSAGVTGVNSDVVMILHLNPTNHAVSILSIPRDLFVPNARANGANKIDAALAESPTQLVNAVEEDFAIPIQHYVELNFDSFASVVDALGGINMYFPEAVYDAESGLNEPTPGCVHLNGTQALAVVRARHLQYKGPGVTTSNARYWPQEAESDLARIRRDHEFLRVLATAVAHQGLGNPLTDRSIVAGVAPQLTVDSGLSAGAMVSLVLAYHSVDANTAPQLTVPVMESSSLTYYYKGYDYGNIELPSEPQDQQTIDKVFGVNSNADTLTGKPLPTPSSVTVSVLNGSGVSEQATTTSAALGALGFDMVGTGDTTPVGPVSETVVYYQGPATEAKAEAVARSMSGAVILAQGPTADGAQVTVVTGSAFAVNPPAAVGGAVSGSSTSRAASGANSSTATTGSSEASTGSSSSASGPGSGAPNSFGTTTQAAEPLQPWDPRACPPGT
jgi:LCP family protein required for cell wall assembly